MAGRRTGIGRLLVVALTLCVCPRLRAQDTDGAEVPVPAGQHRTASGRVLLPGPDSTTRPVARQRVVLHRVGSDQAGPLDSTITTPQGTYHFAYITTGAPDAVYFASATVDGVTYVTAPFATPAVVSPAGDVMVFDTTSSGITIQAVGRHLVIGAPDASGARAITDVFDLENSGSRTLVTRSATAPLWTAPLPDGADSPAVSGGDIAAGGAVFAPDGVRLFAPVSPGVHQLAVTYTLKPSAFPLTVQFAGGAAVVEVLLEEEAATAAMPGLAQQASVSSAGRTFKRYVAQDVAPGAVLQVRAGSSGGAARTRFIAGVVFAMAVVMALALVAALVPRKSSPA